MSLFTWHESKSNLKFPINIELFMFNSPSYFFIFHDPAFLYNLSLFDKYFHSMLHKQICMFRVVQPLCLLSESS